MSPYVEKYWGGWNSQIYRKTFNPKNIKIIVCKNRRIGLYNHELRDEFAYIVNIQVTKSYQNKGIGSFVLKTIECEAIKKNYKKIRLEVFKDNPSKNLYKKIGYRIIKVKKHSIVMQKLVK
jgi:ribosomal protein S18 acetylase RimI-like enzyme